MNPNNSLPLIALLPSHVIVMIEADDFKETHEASFNSTNTTLLLYNQRFHLASTTSDAAANNSPGTESLYISAMEVRAVVTSVRSKRTKSVSTVW